MTISFALENFAFPDAIFLSERLHAEGKCFWVVDKRSAFGSKFR